MSYFSKSRLLFTALLVCMLFVCVHSSEAQAYSINKNCENPHGIGKIFFKFDKLILFFKEIPPEQAYKPDEFPAEFTASSIQRMAEEAVIKNFAGCDANIKEKVNSAAGTTSDMFDSDNVAFYIRLRYPPVEKNGDNKAGYAVLQISPYRADLSDDEMFTLLAMTKTYVLFPLRNPQEFKQQFQSALEAALTPAYHTIPPK